MKVLGSFVDCVCEPHLYKEDIGDIKTKLISRLPDKRICEMASVLIIDTKYDAYVVKIRRPEVNSRGCVDVEKTHKKIYEADFIEILKRDYEGLNWKEIAKKTNELMKPGSFVIFKTDVYTRPVKRKSMTFYFVYHSTAISVPDTSKCS